MQRKFNTAARHHTEMATQAVQQRDQALEWISSNALAAFRSTWCDSGSGSSSAVFTTVELTE